MKGAAWRKGGQPAILDFSLTDVNECLTPGVCAHGRCINLEGSFRCSCEQGYEVTLDEKGCQGTKILKHPSSTANQPVAPSLHTHTPTPGPASLTMLIQRITAKTCPFPYLCTPVSLCCPGTSVLQSPTQKSMACFRCQRVYQQGLVPHGSLSQH